jgi:hypothetical protein
MEAAGIGYFHRFSLQENKIIGLAIVILIERKQQIGSR